MRRTVYAILLFLAAASLPMKAKETETPRIVNIINFVRQCEPREPERLSPQVLYETTLSQVRFLRKHGLTGTWLLQYDALIDPVYTDMLKELDPAGFRTAMRVARMTAFMAPSAIRSIRSTSVSLVK